MTNPMPDDLDLEVGQLISRAWIKGLWHSESDFSASLKSFVRLRESRLKEKIDKLIADEMLICHREKQPTSRLTSLAMKVSKINNI